MINEKKLEKVVYKFVKDIGKIYAPEPMDGDETEAIADRVLNELNYRAVLLRSQRELANEDILEYKTRDIFGVNREYNTLRNENTKASKIKEEAKFD